jgi:hypothetical protein
MTAHYLQPLQKTALPARHVIFDTETQPRRIAGAVEHRYATGCSDTNERWGPTTRDTPEALWQAITAECRKGARTVAWAHNLSFDLRVSEALRWLPRMGFHLQGIVLERTASWASWTSKEHGSLICCDLYAWLPRSLDDIAKETGVSRETWGEDRYAAATLPELQARCMEDVQITRQAVQALLTWLQAEDCGPFRLTGSGQAHACWRKRFGAGKLPSYMTEIEREVKDGGGVWVHGDPELRQIEREAMWTGRCEAWRHGEVDGPLYEYDMNLAYCRIAATHPLPVHLRGEHGWIGHEQFKALLAGGCAILAEVDIERLTEPVVPARAGERMIWPVGTFSTVLWDPELQLLTEDNSLTLHIKRCWTYHTGPALKPMAEWIIMGLCSPDTPAPIRLLLKHWARALIGRMALRYRRWELYSWDLPELDCLLWTGRDEDGQPVERLQVGSESFTLADLEETETSVPQITGWVMSQCRARLWQLIQAACCENVLYMDTDSLLVGAIGHQRLHQIATLNPTVEAELVLKAKWDHATIHGPRNIELDQDRRLSGVPRSSTRVGPLEWEGTVMRGVKESIIRGELDHVAQLERTYHVNTHDPRRERYPDGSTRPYRLGGEE